MRRALLILLLLQTTLPATAADLHGRLDLDAGTLDHPLGLADEPATAVQSARLLLIGTTPQGGGHWRGTLEGGLDLYGPELPQDASRVAVGLERLSDGGPGRAAMGVGLRWTTRRQLQDVLPYDSDELDGYLVRKAYPRPDLMLRALVGARLRTYADLPEESFVEPHALLEVKRFGAERSALGAVVRLGGKWFHDDVAAAVWGTAGTPLAAQLAADLTYSRSLGERTGLRLSAGGRLALADFPYWVQDDLVDSPLLDRYARSGPHAAAAVKWLAPAGVWLDAGLDWARDDYGAIRFAAADGPDTRRDTVLGARLTAEKNLGAGADGARLRASMHWRDQDSSLTAYTWRGAILACGVSWHW